jgi:hypothetical protein
MNGYGFANQSKQGSSEPELILVKRLTKGEKNDNWVKIPASAYSFFPPDSVVRTRINGKVVTMKVNDRGYMWPELLLWAQFARLLSFDEERDELVFTKGRDGIIEISRRRQQP